MQKEALFESPRTVLVRSLRFLPANQKRPASSSFRSRW